jgi:hypothetical protein
MPVTQHRLASKIWQFEDFGLSEGVVHGAPSTVGITLTTKDVGETEYFGAVVSPRGDHAAGGQIMEMLVSAFKTGHEHTVGGEVEHMLGRFATVSTGTGIIGGSARSGVAGRLRGGATSQATGANCTCVPRRDLGELRPLSLLNDVDEVHHAGEGGLGSHDGRLLK